MGSENVLAGCRVKGAVVRNLPVFQVTMELAQYGVHARRGFPGIGSLATIHAGDVEQAVRMMNDDRAQRGNRSVECLPQRQLFLFREIYGVRLQQPLRQSEEFRMLRGVW